MSANWTDEPYKPTMADLEQRIIELEAQLAGERALVRRLRAAANGLLGSPPKGRGRWGAIAEMYKALALTPERALAEEIRLSEYSL